LIFRRAFQEHSRFVFGIKTALNDSCHLIEWFLPLKSECPHNLWVRYAIDLNRLEYEKIYQSEPQCMDQGSDTADTSCPGVDFHFIIYSIKKRKGAPRKSSRFSNKLMSYETKFTKA
jgi:hypothetical protein